MNRFDFPSFARTSPLGRHPLARVGIGILCAVLGAWSPVTGPAHCSEAPAAAALFLGKPVDYWVAEARGGTRREAPARIVEALTAALADASPETRVAAGDALGFMGGAAKPAAAALVAQLDHASPWVRTAASETLAGLKADALPELIEGFKKGSTSVRVRVGLIFQAMGDDARAAVPIVKQHMTEDAGPAADLLKEIIAGLEGTRDARQRHDGGAQGLVLDVRPPATPDRDWPGFRGPRRDGICAETGLLQEWSPGGPPLAWKAEGLGRGFSSVSIAGTRLFTMGDRTADGAESQFLICLDIETKKELWSVRVGPPHQDGPRCTPTVDDDRVYALGTDSDVVCASIADGRVLWQRSLAKEFGARMMSVWKFSESPLVDGERLVVTPGGPEAAVAALDKRTGATLWRCAVPELGPKGRDGAGYSSAVAADIRGVRQYVQLLGRGVVGIEAATGRFLWGCNAVANTTANITSPIVCGNHVFASTAYNTGCALLQIVRDGERWRADEVYFLPGKAFQNHHGGMVMLGRCIYAGDGPNRGAPACLEAATGELMWKADAPERGSAALLYADGRLIFRYDRGPVHLVEATPRAFRPRGSFVPLQGKGPAWAHPVIHRGMLYLRHDDLLAVYDLRAK